MDSRRFSVITIVLLLMPLVASALTPSEALNKAKAKISAAKSLSADFSLTMGGKSTSGKLITKGSKFALTSGLTSSWYDGTCLYVYNPSTSETTVIKPSDTELAESNPLSYINSSGNYNVSGSKQATSGMETVVLIPKKSGTGIKNVMIQLNSSTFLPSKITMTPTSGGKITISLSNIKLNATVADSQFTYPKSQYPKAKIIDLR